MTGSDHRGGYRDFVKLTDFSVSPVCDASEWARIRCIVLRGRNIRAPRQGKRAHAVRRGERGTQITADALVSIERQDPVIRMFEFLHRPRENGRLIECIADDGLDGKGQTPVTESAQDFPRRAVIGAERINSLRVGQCTTRPAFDNVFFLSDVADDGDAHGQEER
jgi:hypothetical protein